ncbi:hypothetical protein CALCODRAFT_536474 [Calocera cornea HHB12733]|uniref:Alpha-type protein kinase domain-containing protein n=1 Tax=Calocera cornea HHB12733 TaxID=1353952 RepID=A0A165HQD9_9BASI|nr:hypothetical protein CALCODRAFT_536474 [Calocera cornea HHB12733]
MDDISPLVTNWEGGRCFRATCGSVIGPRDAYQLIRPRDANGRELGPQMVCIPCHEHYKNKPGTLRRTQPDQQPVLPGPPPPPQPPAPTHHIFGPDTIAGIRHQTSSAQRIHFQGGKSPVKAVGLQLHTPYAAGAAIGPPGFAASGPFPLASAGYQHGVQYPVAAVAPGYSANHALYAQRREMTRMMAAGGRAETVNVNASVQYLVEGKSRPKQMGNITERLNGVPASLLPAPLKEYTFSRLYRKIQRDSHDFPFRVDSFELCGPGYSDMESDPDVPPMYNQCYRNQTKNGVTTRVFAPQVVVEVTLVVKKEVWPSVLQWIEDKLSKLNEEHAGQSAPDRTAPAKTAPAAKDGFVTAVPAPIPSLPEGKKVHPAGYLMFAKLIPELQSRAHDPDTPRSSKRFAQGHDASPDESAIQRALVGSDPQRIHRPPSGATLVYRGTFLPIPVLSWQELVDGPNGPQKLQIDYEGLGCEAILRTNESTQNMTGPPGTFKTCYKASITLGERPLKWINLPEQPMPVSCRTPVAAKRYFIRSNPGGSRMRTSIPVETRFMEGEGNLLYFGTGLHGFSVNWVDRYLLAHPDSAASQLPIPQTRMVYGGLFLHGPDSGDKRNGLVILIEELVRDEENGKGKGFMKFISNASPVPRLKEGSGGVVARYLSFFQHLQYVKTGRRAFISDYQGSLTLLSDPQILTHPDLGPLFGDGNVSTSFEDFSHYHPCNEYCRAFGLKPLHVDMKVDSPPGDVNRASKTPSDSHTSELPSIDDVIEDVLANKRTEAGPMPSAGNGQATASHTLASMGPPTLRKSERLQAKGGGKGGAKGK